MTVLKVKVLLWMIRTTISEWHKTVWKQDPDNLLCCSGRDCGCHGATNNDYWSSYK